MLTQVRRVIFSRQVMTAYCATCHALFGKTISVMAGEAADARTWYGPASAAFIDWLLADPDHCAKQLFYYTRKNRL